MVPSRFLRASFLVGLALLTNVPAAEPVLRVIRAGTPATSLIPNGGFEAGLSGLAAPWKPFGAGYHAVPRQGRQGSRCAVAEASGEMGAGASQTLTLRQSTPAPLIIRGWSKAENVSGNPDNNYSIYLDLVYADGTSLWGQTANFRCGSHDWELREHVVLPEKPVKSLTIYCLLRGHSGKAWFDDVSVEEVTAGEDAVVFQGVPMQRGAAPHSSGAIPQVKTADGLALGGAGGPLAVDGQALAPPGTTGFFLARDVAAQSDVFGFQDGECPELGLKIKPEFSARPDHLAIAGRITDVTGKDRAITLFFALPVDAAGWFWHRDIRHREAITGRGEYSGTVGVRCGATGTMSQYPLAAISNNRTGLALGLDMAHPAQYRLSYHAGTKQFLIAFDFGLVKDTERFPSSADFRFVLFRFDPAWGFRAAFWKYMAIFPEHFAVRSRDQGMWMPFTDVSKVDGWEDFGFRYHEGNNNVLWDDAHDILSFRYTEPMTWWMPLPPGVTRNLAQTLRVRDELTQSKIPHTRRLATVTRVAAMFDEAGQPALQFRDTPWCNGAVWSLNPNPHLPAEQNGATIHWNAEIAANLYGAPAKGNLDGEYLDSLEGYVTAELNHRREHFRHTTVPLTFALDTRAPALFKGLAVAEFTRWMSEDVHRRAKLMFANGVPYRFAFLAPWLDVLGTETDWLRGGKYRPALEVTMNFWRTLSGAKPYLLLMNTDYNALTPDLVERYFQRALFYGMFPGMFSHNASENPYWQNPAWYNRDRHLFKQYQPLIKRIAEAGWQPVTGARSDHAAVFVERFGPDAGGSVYLTLLNDTDSEQTGTVTLDPSVLNPAKYPVAQELIAESPVRLADGRFSIALPPQTARLIRLLSPPR